MADEHKPVESAGIRPLPVLSRVLNHYDKMFTRIIYVLDKMIDLLAREEHTSDDQLRMALIEEYGALLREYEGYMEFKRELIREQREGMGDEK